MSNSKNFATQFLTKPASSRSLTDPVPEEEETLEQPELPTPQEMIDSLYTILMQRLDKIEKLIEKDCQCQKK
jgi:FixJ family two-component response regulator